jgi:WD40 repeat protein
MTTAWPLPGDYAEAVQEPSQAFRDPELCAGQPVVNRHGLPLMWTGNFAAVFSVTGAAAQSKKWAVKCFTRQVPDLHERYHRIAAHLQQYPLPFMVDFRYLADGVRVKNQWYPLLRMDWVEGLRLDEFLAECLKQPNYKSTLHKLCDMWVRLARMLREREVGHGDLQHGNVLLIRVQGKEAYNLRLIDYDGMYVPALAGNPPDEVGHAAFQHPQRLAQGGHGPEIDRFSHLLIYTTLRCLIAGGRELWDTYYNGDRLLVGHGNLAAPAKSRVFRDLWQLPDEPARHLVGHLILAAKGPLENVPLLDALIRGSDVIGLTAAQQREVESLLFGTSVAAPGAAPKTKAEPAAAPQPVSEAELVPREQLAPAGRLTRTPRVRALEGHSGLVTAVAFSPDGGRILTGSSDRTAILWNTATGKILCTFQPHIADVRAVAFSPEGRRVVTGTLDGAAILWDVASGAPQYVFRRHTAAISSVAFSPNGEWLLTGSEDASAAIWDATTYGLLGTYGGHGAGITAVAFSPNSQWVLTGSADTTAVLHDTFTGQAAKVFLDHWGAVWCVAFSPDGTLAATGSDDSTAMLWDVATGRRLRTFEGHAGDVRSVAFSPDRRYLLTGSWDRSAMLWDLQTQRAILRLSQHAAAVTSVAFSPDGAQVLTGSWDRTAQLWSILAEEPQLAKAAADLTPVDAEASPEPEDEPPSSRMVRTLQAIDQVLKRAAGRNEVLHSILRGLAIALALSLQMMAWLGVWHWASATMQKPDSELVVSNELPATPPVSDDEPAKPPAPLQVPARPIDPSSPAAPPSDDAIRQTPFAPTNGPPTKSTEETADPFSSMPPNAALPSDDPIPESPFVPLDQPPTKLTEDAPDPFSSTPPAAARSDPDAPDSQLTPLPPGPKKPPTSSTLRSWTNTEGTVIATKARFVRIHGHDLVLLSGLKVLKIKLWDLSAESEQQLREELERKGDRESLLKLPQPERIWSILERDRWGDSYLATRRARFLETTGDKVSLIEGRSLLVRDLAALSPADQAYVRALNTAPVR